MSAKVTLELNTLLKDQVFYERRNVNKVEVKLFNDESHEVEIAVNHIFFLIFYFIYLVEILKLRTDYVFNIVFALSTLRKGNCLMNHSLRGEKATSVLLKLFFNSNKNTTLLTPLALAR